LFGVEGEVVNGAARAVVLGETIDLDHWFSFSLKKWNMCRQTKGTRAGGQPCHLLSYRVYYTEIQNQSQVAYDLLIKR
jgi:hypothetical protein